MEVSLILCWFQVTYNYELLSALFLLTLERENVVLRREKASQQDPGITSQDYNYGHYWSAILQ